MLCRREALGAKRAAGSSAHGIWITMAVIALAAVIGVAALRVSTRQPAETASATPQDARLAASREEVPSAPQPPPQKQSPFDTAEARLERARRDVQIVMYGARWCGACRGARSDLARADVRYVYRDIDSDRDASARLGVLNPRRTIPTFEVDGDVMVGFERSQFAALVSRAARRRL